MIRCKEKFGGTLWETYLLDVVVVTAACQTATIAALSFGSSSYYSSSAETVVEATGWAADPDVTMIAAATTAVFGSSSYCSSSVAMALAYGAETDADVTAITHGTMAAETTVAANSFGNGLGGIFGCPSCHENNLSLIETLKLFLPYFPLHIQRLVTMYLNLLEFMHTFEMIQNMMNHMDEYQALFKMFEGMGGDKTSPSSSFNPMSALAPFLGGGGGFAMPDIGAMQKMMEGSDLVDEFTYVEEPSGTGRYGS